MAVIESKKGIVVGLGVMGNFHVRVLNAMPEVEALGVVDIDQSRLTDLEKEYKGISTFTNFSDAISELEANFVCIAVPSEHLAQLGLMAIENGLAVLVEKPMALNEENALDLINAARDNDVQLSVGYVERHNPAVVEAKTRIENDEVGRIYQVHARRLSPLPLRESQSGVTVDLATHDIDVMRYLTGSEVDRVYAETAQRSHNKSEDLVCASLKFADDVKGLLEVNWLTPSKVRQLTITGEKGMLVIEYISQDLTFYENPRANVKWDALGLIRGTGEGNMIRYALERREPLKEEWTRFFAAMDSNQQPFVSGYDGLAALSTANAIQESGRENNPVVPSYRHINHADLLAL